MMIDDEFNDFDLMIQDFLQNHFDNADASSSPFSSPEENRKDYRESVLFLEVTSVRGLSSKASFCGVLDEKYACEVEIEQTSHSSQLSPGVINGTEQGHVLSETSNQWHWNIIELYGPTPVTFTILRKSGYKYKPVLRQSLTIASLIKAQRNGDIALPIVGASPTNSSGNTSWMIPEQLALHKIGRARDAIDLNRSHSHSEARSASGGRWFKPSLSSKPQSAIPYARANACMAESATETVVVSFRFRVVEINRCMGLHPFTQSRNLPQVVEIGDGFKQSELHYLCSCGPSFAIVEVLQRLAVAKALQRALALTDSEGRSPFSVALLSGNESVVRALLQRAGNWCTRNFSKGTANPLHFAVRGNSVVCLSHITKFMKLFCSGHLTASPTFSFCQPFDVVVEWVDENGFTPLTLACHLGYTQMVEQLIQSGASVGEITSGTSQTPLMIACTMKRSDIVQLLLEPLVPLEDRHVRSSLRSTTLPSRGISDESSVRKHACRPGIKDTTNQRTALHFAVRYGAVPIVKQLIDIGCSCLDTDIVGDTVFHSCARYGDDETAKIIVGTESKNWMLYKLCKINDGKSLETMLYRRRGLLCKNLAGNSAIDCAILSGNMRMARYFVVAAAQIYGEQYIFTRISLGEPPLQRLMKMNASNEERDVTCVLSLMDGADGKVSDTIGHSSSILLDTLSSTQSTSACTPQQGADRKSFVSSPNSRDCDCTKAREEKDSVSGTGTSTLRATPASGYIGSELDWALGAGSDADDRFQIWVSDLVERHKAASGPAVTETSDEEVVTNDETESKNVNCDAGVEATDKHLSHRGIYKDSTEITTARVKFSLTLDNAFLDDDADDQEYRMALTPLALKKYAGGPNFETVVQLREETEDKVE